MTNAVAWESLERRDHFAATGLDADYGISIGAIRRATGQNVSIYQAVPAPGERTYLLAERYEDTTDARSTGYLTIIRLNAKGRLDPSFGTGGIALTGRITQKHIWSDRSGLLKVDDGGRLYFADNNRVLRFHSDGTTDRTFGTNGAISFASADNKVALCDITPVDNGVLVATTKTDKQVEYFAVQKVGRTAKTVFAATHTAPHAPARSGNGYEDNQELATDQAQFARSAGGIVLARIETDYTTYTEYESPDSDNPGAPYTATGVKEQNLVVTRLDTTGHGSDVFRKPLRRRYGYDETALGNFWHGYAAFFDNNNVYLSDNARFLLVQSDQEVDRVDLRRNTIERYSLKPALYANFTPSYQLLGDGYVYVQDQSLGHNFELVTTLNRYTYDGKLDRKFGKNGVLTFDETAYVPGDRQFINQLFLGTSGRLYFLAERSSLNNSTFTVRRVG